MLEVNVPNVITIILISALGIALVKVGLNFAGRSDWAAYI